MIKENRYLRALDAYVLSMHHMSTGKKMKIQVIKNLSPLLTDLISLVRILRSFRKPTMPNIVLCLILYLSFPWYSC